MPSARKPSLGAAGAVRDSGARYAIFVLGYAPSKRKRGPLREKEKALTRALVRMHRNPRMEDVIRAFVQNTKVDPDAISL